MFWKLLVNSVYGKLIEDVEKYLDIKLILGGPTELLKSSGNFRWKESIPVNENTSIQLFHPTKYLYSKPLGEL
jgi:hypothetical protein